MDGAVNGEPGSFDDLLFHIFPPCRNTHAWCSVRAMMSS